VAGQKETDLTRRYKAWFASKEVGKVLKEGLVNLQRLRNQTVQALGYPDYFTYQVSDYGMSTDEMIALNKQFIRDIWPLYRELHTYMRYELAKRYGVKESGLCTGNCTPTCVTNWPNATA